MRNLKKILALALALVMAMSLMTVANAANFSDSADISYKEAVDVMVGIGVIDGMDDGSFDPNGTLTREQAAKLIATMMLGENAEKLGTTKSSFTDVAATRWSAPYIEYCVSSGFIAGMGDGTFNPTGKLTGYAFAKLLLCALGYDAARENYTGDGWTIEVAKDAAVAGIAVDGVAMSAELTREEAAQMAFQTLEATTVEYATAGSTVITPDGTQVITGGSTASKVEVSDKKAGYYGEADGYVQFCETYFADLKKNSGASDEFDRPGYDWTYDGQKIAFTSEDPLATFTTETKESAVKSAIKSVYDGSTKVSVYTDGKNTGDATTYKNSADLTGNGVTVQVFSKEDSDGKDVPDCIVVINEHVGKITRVGTNDDDERYVRVAGTDYVTEGFERGDYVVYTMGEDDDGSVIMSMTAAKSVEGEVTAEADDYIRIDGTKYEFNKEYTNKLKAGDDCLVYLDTQGNILSVGDATSDPEDYAYVKAIESNLGDYRAKLVLADGQTVTVDVDDEDGDGNALKVNDGEYVSYTVDDGVYTLTKMEATTDYVALAGGAKIEKGSAKIVGKGGGTVATANGDTVYVDIKNDKVYTGYRNVSTMETVAGAVFEEDGVATVVFITANDLTGNSDSTKFFVADEGDYESFKQDKTTYYKHIVYIDGEETELTVNAAVHSTITTDGAGLYTVKATNNDDYVTSLDGSAVKLSAMQTYKATVASGETLIVGAVASNKFTRTNSYTYDENTLFIKVELDGSDVDRVYEADADDITTFDTSADEDENASASYVYVLVDADDDDELATVVYIID